MANTKTSDESAVATVDDADEFRLTRSLASMKATMLKIRQRVAAAYFDADATMAANSDDKVPTQRASRLYIAAAIASLGLGTGSTLTKDTDGTLAANSDARVPSQKAIKTYVDAAGGGGSLPFATLQSFGTVANNGTTDDAATFQAAAASGARFVFACGLNCRIGATVNIPAGQTWLLAGTSINFTGNTLTVFAATTVDDWHLVGPFSITGAGSTSGSAKGISVTGCNRWTVADYGAKSIQGHGLYLAPGTPSGTLRADQGRVTNMLALSCYVGWEDTPGTGAEYCTLTAPAITGCGTGMITAAGNIVVQGGHITDNTGDGVILRNGSNHGHGIFTGTNISHNGGYNLHADQVVNGHDFVGCHFYGSPGTIRLNQSKGVMFSNGHLDCAVESVTGGSSGRNYFDNMHCPGTSIAVSGTGTGELTFTRMRGPGADDGGGTPVPINDPAPVYVHVERAGGSTHSISGATNLLFNTEAFDRQSAYEPSTGTFTVPPNETGNYRFSGNIIVGGTGLASNSYIDFKVAGTSSHLLTGNLYSTTKLVFSFSFDRYLQAGQTVVLEATISGSSVVHGDSTWKSTFSVQRIQ